MTRRELLVLGKNLFISLAVGTFSCGCGLLGEKINSVSQIASWIGYLLYGDNTPDQVIEEIKNHLEVIVQSSLRKRLELEWLCFRINLKYKSGFFEALSPQKKRDVFRELMPMLVKHSVITGAISQYLEGDRVLEYLDYPDLPGEFGECGWIVLESSVWDRYYPHSGS